MSESKSALVLYSVDRTFVKNSALAWLVSFLESWLVGGQVNFEDVEDTIMDAQFGSLTYEYGKYAEQKESDGCLSNCLEYMIIQQSGRVIP